MPLIEHVIAAVADERHHAAQEQVHLAVFGQRVERAAAHEPVVRVVVHEFHAQQLHEAVKPLRRGALEERVRFAAAAHAVDDVAAFEEFLHELRQHGDVVLQIGVQADGAVRARAGFHEPGEQGVLMAAVVRQLQPAHKRVFARKRLDETPRAVAAAVVHKEHAAFFAGQPLRLHLGKALRELPHRFRQDFLLVIARNHQIDRWLHRLVSLPGRFVWPPGRTGGPAEDRG